MSCPSPTPLRTVNVSTPTALTNAVNAAIPGDRIVMADGVYAMADDLLCDADGTDPGASGNQIELIGGGQGVCILDFGAISSSNRLRILGNWWIMHGFSHRDSYTGPTCGEMTDFGGTARGAHHNIICDVEVFNCSQQGFRVRGEVGISHGGPSSFNTFQECHVHDVGQEAGSGWQFGEGFYIGKGSGTPEPVHDNQFLSNLMGPNVTAEHFDVKPDTYNILVQGNICDATGFQYVTGSQNTPGVFQTQTSDGCEFRDNVINNVRDPGTQGGTHTLAACIRNFASSNIKVYNNQGFRDPAVGSTSSYRYGFYSDGGGSANEYGCNNNFPDAEVSPSNLTCQGDPGGAGWSRRGTARIKHATQPPQKWVMTREGLYIPPRHLAYPPRPKTAWGWTA